jgi:hypothetical protein
VLFVKIPFVKEWGSWVVFGASCLAAVAAGFSTHTWEAGRDTEIITTIAGLFFLINIKPPLVAAFRTKGTKSGHIAWGLIFMAAGLLLLAPFLRSGIDRFAPFFVLAVSYVLFVWSGKEHNVFAELNGFALLTASAPLVYFVITGVVSIKLYAAVLFFFAAGVLKVRMRIRKTIFFRILMIAYCAVVINIYYVMRINVLLLVPFSENIISALWLREHKLKTTGYIELAKSIVFVVLIGLLWEQ